MGLSPGEKRLLVDLAWSAFRSFIEGRDDDCPPGGPEGLTPSLTRHGGVFVTVYLRGEPRGCVGTVLPVLPIWQACRENARNAAYKDPRFLPLEVGDLFDVTLEIAIIDNPRPLGSSPVTPATSALMVSRGGRREVFLPGALEGMADGDQEALERLRSKVHIDADESRDPEEWTIFDVEIVR